MRNHKIPIISRFTSSESDTRGDYGRLTPSGPSGCKLFGWRRFALAAVLLLLFVLVLGPRHTRDRVFGHANYPTQPTNILKPEVYPTSPDTDPDPSRTVYCEQPYKPDHPLVQYALLIDAGSTGSRIHIYKFHNCHSQPTYEYEVFRQKRPGLSSFADSPSMAAASLDDLLDDAMKVVPSQLHSCTPVAVRATAGLRLLGTSQSSEILLAVQSRLLSRYPFSLDKKTGVAILDGKDEGVNAWVTVNYLLHMLGPGADDHAPNYAVLDLGGASTQIVIEASRASASGTSLREGDHKYVLEFSGFNHTLYQHSYLGYGLMEARKSVHRLVHFMSTLNKEPHKEAQTDIANPCLSAGTSRVIVLDEQESFNMTGSDIGSFVGCKRVIELVMAKDAICSIKPCSFNGIHQPSIMEIFPMGNIVLLSYFYDRISPLLGVNNNVSPGFPIKRIAELANAVCQGPSSWGIRFGHDEEAMKELRDRPEYCLDLTFMYSLLRFGYEFDDNRLVSIAKQIDSTELGWALGAGIALVGSHIECAA